MGPETTGAVVRDSVSEPSIELRGATKNFGAVRGLRRIDIRLTQGEVVGLVGDNAADKSTLAKALLPRTRRKVFANLHAALGPY